MASYFVHRHLVGPGQWKWLRKGNRTFKFSHFRVKTAWIHLLTFPLSGHVLKLYPKLFLLHSYSWEDWKKLVMETTYDTAQHIVSTSSLLFSLVAWSICGFLTQDFSAAITLQVPRLEKCPCQLSLWRTPNCPLTVIFFSPWMSYGSELHHNSYVLPLLANTGLHRLYWLSGTADGQVTQIPILPSLFGAKPSVGYARIWWQCGVNTFNRDHLDVDDSDWIIIIITFFFFFYQFALVSVILGIVVSFVKYKEEDLG